MSKEIVCIICHETITKRKSLSFGKGRACRVHDEVIQMLEDNQYSREMEKLADQAKKRMDEMFTVISLSQQIRISHTFKDIPLAVMLERVRFTFGGEIRSKVMDELDKNGLGISSEDLILALELFRRRNEELKEL